MSRPAALQGVRARARVRRLGATAVGAALAMSTSCGVARESVSEAAAPPAGVASEAAGPPAAAASGAAAAKVSTKTMYVTGYTWYDNTPAGSATISHPVLHRKAGGSGTWKDPITVAVGHRYVDGRDVLDFTKGTRFYLPYLDRYFIVEDTCGDGPHPERGPCHVHPKGTDAWLDIWLGGKGLGSKAATRCAEKITGKHTVQVNPPKTHKVIRGAVARLGHACGR